MQAIPLLIDAWTSQNGFHYTLPIGWRVTEAGFIPLWV